jgi:ATP-dependent RNA helicase DeaD
MNELKEFKDMGLSPNTLKALKKKGFEEPTEVQRETIPLLMKQKTDIIVQAQTGTGKTASFGIPMIEKLVPSKKGVQAIILTPTRELAIQVSEEINSLKGTVKLSVAPIYGGQSIENQFRKLKSGIDIVVGTPGRVIDHINRGTLKLENIEYFILDEADEMLNMGFIEEVEEILKSTPTSKTMMLFSATMPQKILSLTKRYMKDATIIKIQKEDLTTSLTEQIYFEVNPDDKLEALCRIIDSEKDFYGLVFCRTKNDVDIISNKLMDRGYDAEALHGDISQFQRERILKKFKSKTINVLIATDVAARGIDIVNLSHVINYSIPQNPEAYVHRIGRTGRAGSEGTAITFVTPSEYRSLVFIKRFAKTEIKKQKLPEVQEIINVKKSRIKDEIFDIIHKEEFHDYLNLAKELIDHEDASNVIAALLKSSYGEELLQKNYAEIKEVKVDTKGTTRLFVALGRNDGYSGPKKLAEYIEKESKVDQKKIRDIRIFEAFSFVTAPFEEAEIIIEAFRKRKKGKRPLIDKAKDKK